MVIKRTSSEGGARKSLHGVTPLKEGVVLRGILHRFEQNGICYPPLQGGVSTPPLNDTGATPVIVHLYDAISFEGRVQLIRSACSKQSVVNDKKAESRTCNEIQGAICQRYHPQSHGIVK